MPGTFIYRIIHIDNLEYIVTNRKLVCPSHPDRDADYKSIGNNEVISRRLARPLPFNRERTFKDYVAFYFGPRSIMLFNIHTGYAEVEKIHQQKIIYLVSNTNLIHQAELEYFFTDGHALQHPVTQFYTDISELYQVNFKDAYARDFSAAAEMKNPGLKHRKQAEFHVFNELSWNMISEIVVYDEKSKALVESVLQRANVDKTVRVKADFYF